MKQIEADTMPVEVATEMLATPGVRMTNRERKLYQLARVMRFSSEVKQKNPGVKLAERLRDKTWGWLIRQICRVNRKRRGLQMKYERAKRLPENPIVLRIIAVMDIQAAAMDSLLDALDTEIGWRKQLASGEAGRDNFVACLRTQRVFTWGPERFTKKGRLLPRRWVVANSLYRSLNQIVKEVVQ